MKLSSDASVFRLTREGATNVASLHDVDKKSIENFPSVYKNSVPAVESDVSNSISAKASISGASISSMLLSRLITAVNAAKCYGSIRRAMHLQNMVDASILETFQD